MTVAKSYVTLVSPHLYKTSREHLPDTRLPSCQSDRCPAYTGTLCHLYRRLVDGERKSCSLEVARRSSRRSPDTPASWCRYCGRINGQEQIRAWQKFRQQSDEHCWPFRLRAVPQLGSVRLIALTGFGQDADRTNSLDAGFDEHFTKPVSLDLLKEIIRRTSAIRVEREAAQGESNFHPDGTVNAADSPPSEAKISTSSE